MPSILSPAVGGERLLHSVVLRELHPVPLHAESQGRARPAGGFDGSHWGGGGQFCWGEPANPQGQWSQRAPLWLSQQVQVKHLHSVFIVVLQGFEGRSWKAYCVSHCHCPHLQTSLAEQGVFVLLTALHVHHHRRRKSTQQLEREFCKWWCT